MEIFLIILAVIAGFFLAPFIFALLQMVFWLTVAFVVYIAALFLMPFAWLWDYIDSH